MNPNVPIYTKLGWQRRIDAFNDDEKALCLEESMLFGQKVHVWDTAYDIEKQLELYFAQGLYHHKTIVCEQKGKRYRLIVLTHADVDRLPFSGIAFAFGKQIHGIVLCVKERCFNCNKETQTVCGRCRRAVYCSKQCLKKMLSTHKKVCKHK
jgi:hypothetical protein